MNGILKKAAIPSGIILGIVIFYLYITANGFSIYNEGIGLIRYSEDELQKELTDIEIARNLNVIELNDDDLDEFLVIGKLIEKSLREKFPLSRDAMIPATHEEVFSNHEYVAAKYSEKYNRPVESYFAISKPDEQTLEMFPDSYRYDYSGRFFKYDGKFYSFYDNGHIVKPSESALVNIGILRDDFNSDRSHVELTDDDFIHIPKVKDAIDQIGTRQENIQVQIGLSASELNKYEKWANKNNIMSVGNFFKYGDEYYRITFWIA